MNFFAHYLGLLVIRNGLLSCECCEPSSSSSSSSFSSSSSASSSQSESQSGSERPSSGEPPASSEHASSGEPPFSSSEPSSSREPSPSSVSSSSGEPPASSEHASSGHHSEGSGEHSGESEEPTPKYLVVVHADWHENCYKPNELQAYVELEVGIIIVPSVIFYPDIFAPVSFKAYYGRYDSYEAALAVANAINANPSAYRVPEIVECDCPESGWMVVLRYGAFRGESSWSHEIAYAVVVHGDYCVGDEVIDSDDDGFREIVKFVAHFDDDHMDDAYELASDYMYGGREWPTPRTALPR